MGNLLSSLSKTIHASLALAVILFLGLFYQNDGFTFDRLFWSFGNSAHHKTKQNNRTEKDGGIATERKQWSKNRKDQEMI